MLAGSSIALNLALWKSIYSGVPKTKAYIHSSQTQFKNDLGGYTSILKKMEPKVGDRRNFRESNEEKLQELRLYT